MTGYVSFAGFESLVSKVVKPESTGVEWGSLFGISDPECNVI